MIAYVTVGVDDIARAKRFYSAFLPALGFELEERPEGLSFALPEQPGQSAVQPEFYVKAPLRWTSGLCRQRDDDRLRGTQSAAGS
jgi:catechol 2,3-dioxygenase-like lactoylglutathione lyase family enzyme